MATQYEKKLARAPWQKKAAEIKMRDNWTCQHCGDTESQLEVHHIKYVGKLPEYTPDEFMITLCHDCHVKAERKKNQPSKEIMQYQYETSIRLSKQENITPRIKKIREQAAFIIKSEMIRIYG